MTRIYDNILSCETVEELREISPYECSRLFANSGFMGQDVIEHMFRICDGLWLHSGNSDDPHAELTSGKCSNGFVDTLRVLKNTNLCEILSYQLYRKIIGQLVGHSSEEQIDWSIGSDHAGATLSYSVARHFNAQHDFTEKGPDKTQIWQRFDIGPEEIVLQVEELITTTATLQAVREGIRVGTPHEVMFAPVIGTLVHRSDVFDFEGSPIVHLIHLDIETWEPDECPLCKDGSPRLRPKQQWKQLTTPVNNHTEIEGSH